MYSNPKRLSVWYRARQNKKAHNYREMLFLSPPKQYKQKTRSITMASRLPGHCWIPWCPCKQTRCWRMFGYMFVCLIIIVATVCHTTTNRSTYKVADGCAPTCSQYIFEGKRYCLFLYCVFECVCVSGLTQSEHRIYTFSAPYTKSGLLHLLKWRGQSIYRLGGW